MGARGEDVMDKWLCEFLLRRLQDPKVSGSRTFSLLSLKDDEDSIVLKKLAALRDIWNHFSQGKVEEPLLDLIEVFEKLQCQEGSVVLGSLQSAYCWAAADITATYIVDEDGSKCSHFLEALQRIWDGRIGVLKGRESALVNWELLKWESDFKESVTNEEVMLRIRLTNTRLNAICSLSKFLREHWVLMDLPYIEIVGPSLIQMDMNTNLEDEENWDDVPNGENLTNVSNRTDVHHTFTMHADDTIDDPIAQCVGDVGETTTEQEQDQVPNVDEGETSEALSFREDLMLLLSLQNYVSDDENGETSEPHSEDTTRQPLQGTVAGTEGQDHTLAENSQNLESHSAVIARQPSQGIVAGIGGHDDNIESANVNAGASAREGTSSRRVLPNFLNPATLNRESANVNVGASARVGTPSRRVRPNPRTPRIRRPRRWWTPEEEEALKEGVKKYGTSWKAIKESNPVVLAHRTQVDLKDKWRNLLSDKSLHARAQ